MDGTSSRTSDSSLLFLAPSSADTHATHARRVFTHGSLLNEDRENRQEGAGRGNRRLAEIRVYHRISPIDLKSLKSHTAHSSTMRPLQFSLVCIAVISSLILLAHHPLVRNVLFITCIRFPSLPIADCRRGSLSYVDPELRISASDKVINCQRASRSKRWYRM